MSYKVDQGVVKSDTPIPQFEEQEGSKNHDKVSIPVRQLPVVGVASDLKVGATVFRKVKPNRLGYVTGLSYKTFHNRTGDIDYVWVKFPTKKSAFPYKLEDLSQVTVN